MSRVNTSHRNTREVLPYNTLRPKQNGRHFPHDIFECIFLNENVWISIKISLKFVPKGPINNITALVQIIAWRRAGGKPVRRICVTRPQWVKRWQTFADDILNILSFKCHWSLFLMVKLLVQGDGEFLSSISINDCEALDVYSFE